MSDPEYGAGDVAIELDGKSLVMRPTMEACLRLSRTGTAGPRVLAEQCLALNLDTITAVIAAGLGKPDSEVQTAVFRTGTINLFAKCIQFIHIVSNGGRPVSEEEAQAATDPMKAEALETITAT